MPADIFYRRMNTFVINSYVNVNEFVTVQKADKQTSTVGKSKQVISHTKQNTSARIRRETFM